MRTAVHVHVYPKACHYNSSVDWPKRCPFLMIKILALHVKNRGRTGTSEILGIIFRGNLKHVLREFRKTRKGIGKIRALSEE